MPPVRALSRPTSMRFEQIEKGRSTTFTPRENGVVNELLKGLTYKEIAIDLGISPTTVNDHLKNVYFKMGVRTKSELIAKVLRK